GVFLGATFGASILQRWLMTQVVRTGSTVVGAGAAHLTRWVAGAGLSTVAGNGLMVGRGTITALSLLNLPNGFMVPVVAAGAGWALGLSRMQGQLPAIPEAIPEPRDIPPDSEPKKCESATGFPVVRYSSLFLGSMLGSGTNMNVYEFLGLTSKVL